MGIRDAIRAIDAASRSSAPQIKRWNVATDDTYKYVTPDAATIATESGIDRNRLALAAMVQSEVASLPAQYLVAVVEVVKNEAAARGISPFELLTRGSKHGGHFGGQSGRYAASGQKPSERAMAAVLASEVGIVRGFARGARNFFDGKVQDGGTQGGVKLTNNAIDIVRKWYGEGKRWIGPVVDGTEVLIDPYRLMLFSRDGKELHEAESAIEDGRARWKSGLPLLPVVAGGAGLLLAAGLGAWFYLRG